MLHLPRRVIVQLAVFTVIAVGVLAITFGCRRCFSASAATR